MNTIADDIKVNIIILDMCMSTDASPLTVTYINCFHRFYSIYTHHDRSTGALSLREIYYINATLYNYYISTILYYHFYTILIFKKISQYTLL